LGVNRREAERITYRQDVTASDRECVRCIVASTGYFSPAEVGIAVELVEERLAKGARSGYLFLFAETVRGVIGYTCFGPIAGTLSSFDIYWVAVHRDQQREGIGRKLLFVSESLIAEAEGRKIFVDTSSRPQYEPTRRFYERCGYRRAAVIEDFYGPGDGKIVYVKDLFGTKHDDPESGEGM